MVCKLFLKQTALLILVWPQQAPCTTNCLPYYYSAFQQKKNIEKYLYLLKRNVLLNLWNIILISYNFKDLYQKQLPLHFSYGATDSLFFQFTCLVYICCKFWKARKSLYRFSPSVSVRDTCQPPPPNKREHYLPCPLPLFFFCGVKQAYLLTSF